MLERLTDDIFQCVARVDAARRIRPVRTLPGSLELKSCGHADEAAMRFSSPGFVSGTSVGVFVKYEGMPDAPRRLRVWWDWENQPGLHEDISLGNEDPIIEVIEHQYIGSAIGDKFKVRVELIVDGQTDECIRVREVELKENAPVVSGSANSSVVIDSFVSGSHSLSACGIDEFSFHSDGSILAGDRELYARDGHSCVLGGRSQVVISPGAGQAEFFGNTAPSQALLYGTEIGTFGSFAVSPNTGSEMNLARQLTDTVEIDVVSLPAGVDVSIRIRSGASTFSLWTGALSVGTNSFALSSFPGLTAADAADIDGISFSTSVPSGNVPGSGLVLSELRFSTP